VQSRVPLRRDQQHAARLVGGLNALLIAVQLAC
jgi:hypothetical protein